MNQEHVDVAAAVIERDGKFLVAKRLPTSSFAGKWEFPGGKVEPAETPAECIVREIEEELGVKTKALELLHTWNFEYPGPKRFRFFAFRCQVLEGEPKVNGSHEMLAWITPDALGELDFLEADHELISMLRTQQ